jgi:hypothetical protein
MKPIDCELESEVLAAVLRNCWPERVDASLREHVAACAICTEVAAVAGAIDGAREEMRASAVVPDSALVWWRAQMRARRESVQAAARPITAVQVIALACAMGLLGACFATIKFQAMIPLTVAFVAAHGVLFLGMAAILLIVPAAVYLTLLRE